jgi:hypothetical protein
MEYKKKTLVKTSQNEKKTLHNIATGSPLPQWTERRVRTIWKGPSKQNLAIYFARLLAKKVALLSLPTLTEVFLSKQGKKGISRGIWNDGITVNE